jgi:hypothetical protein
LARPPLLGPNSAARQHLEVDDPMTKRFTRRFTALPREEREALIDTKEARFRERLARELKAFGPATKPPPSPRDRVIRQAPASGCWRTGKENPRSRAVRTPAGVFDSVSQAGKAFGLCRQSAARLARKRRDGWSYVDVGS